MRADTTDPAATHTLKGRRIIFVFGSLELGGAERQALILARHLSEHVGARVQVWGFNLPGPVASLCEQYGLAWRVVPFYFSASLKQRLIRLLKLARTLRAEYPDLLLPYTLIPNVACGLVWRLAGARACVWSQRDAGIAHLDPAWELAAARLTPQFVAISQEGADYLTERLKARPARVRLIRNGVEPPAPLMSRDEWRARLGADGNCFVACMVANLHRYKDHVTLLRAWRVTATTLRARGRSALLVLAGRHDDAYASLSSLARELGIERSVFFAGYVADVAGLLAASDICVFSSRSEGCPNGVLEGMAAGLAVAGSDIMGIRQAVGRGAVTLLAPPGDAPALAEIMLRLADDPALRDALGAENRRRVREVFDPLRMCKEHVALFDQCLAMKPR
jgi:glycosyltransferase involved in cell wall biosynthesis